MSQSRVTNVATPSTAVSTAASRRSVGRGAGGWYRGRGAGRRAGGSGAGAWSRGRATARRRGAGSSGADSVRSVVSTAMPARVVTGPACPQHRRARAGLLQTGRGDRRDRLDRMTGRLVLGGAPLGQPGDVGPRLRQAMASADVVACEDTRRLHRLAGDLEVTLTGRVVTFHESVEKARLPGLVAALTGGRTVLL